MKIHLERKDRKIIGATVTGALLLAFVVPQPAQAIFGLGDIVFDPTSYATLGSIMTSNTSMLAKAITMYNQTVKIYSNGVSMYGRMMANAQFISHLNRVNWLTTLPGLVNETTANRYGETVNWGPMMNGNPFNSHAVYANATLNLNSLTALVNGMTPGSSVHMANLASIEANDGAAARCLDILSAYNKQEQQSAAAASRLENAELDDSADNNSEVEQLNLLNAAELQKTNEMRAQGQVQACLAEQQLVHNTYERNAQAESLNMYNEAAEATSSVPLALNDPSESVNTWMPQ